MSNRDGLRRSRQLGRSAEVVPLITKHTKYAKSLRVTAKLLRRVMFIQIIANIIRALPIFILERYLAMIIIIAQFLVIGGGYYGVNRLSSVLLLFYIVGELVASSLDVYFTSMFANSHTPIYGGQYFEKVAIGYFSYVGILSTFNFITSVFLGTKILVAVIKLNFHGSRSSVLFMASLIGNIDASDEEAQTDTKQPSRIIFYNHTEDIPPRKSFWNSLFSAKPPDEEPENDVGPYISNVIKTSKYNVVTFIPKVLYLQFSRVANLYTLAIVFLCIFSFSPVSPASSITPLAVVIFTSAVKELVEDVKRHKADREVNGRKISLCRSNSPEQQTSYQSGELLDVSFVDQQWKDVKVGDIVTIYEKQLLPADIVLLSSSREDSRCYLETSNLDGETNLKIRSVPSKIGWIKTKKDLAKIHLKLECEGPNNRIYEFDGVLDLYTGSNPNNREKIPIGPDNILLRGTTLKNTEHVYGLVIYTGKDTKIEQNATPAPQKRSNVEKSVNMKLMFLLVLQSLMCIVCSIGHNDWQITGVDSEDFPWYLGTKETYNFIYVSYVILYNTLIPLSMYVSMEMVRVINSQFINNDLEMYHPDNDIPAMARNTNILEELGQIQYVLSDKTGTLTNNEMVFYCCSVAGVMYGIQSSNPLQNLVEDIKQSKNEEEIQEFLIAMTICNTVLVDQATGSVRSFNEAPLKYHATSPDEEALVVAAAKLGFELRSRIGDKIVIAVFGVEYTYDVLSTIDFNSYRKRMSIICRTPSGDIKLFCKGADSAIFPRLAPGSKDKDIVAKHVNIFANEGLRTLAFSSKTIPSDEFQLWAARFKEAGLAMHDRQKLVDDVAEVIEKNMVLLGAAGIEDKLQDGVPDCIESLMMAGIKVWVLTGDKLETAMSVSTSCALINSDMDIVVFTETNKDDIQKKLDQITNQYKLAPEQKPWFKKSFEYLVDQYKRVEITVNSLRRYSDRDLRRSSPRSKPLALVVDGAALNLVLDHDMRYLFLQCAKAAVAVVCCRCTPLHKAKVVKLVSERSFVWGDGTITLAIGDGANDVPMIQRAHVGVGVSGREGRQAVLSSDFAVPQFKCLKRLLLIHGNRSYSRIIKLIMYSFCKNTAMALSQFWFGFIAGFSGQMMFFDYLFTLYNALFTAIPIILLAVLDQKYTEAELLERPGLYENCAKNKNFDTAAFLRWIMLGIWQSFVIFFFPFISMNPPTPDGQILGLWSQGTTSYTCLIIAMNIQLLLISKFLTKANLIAIIGSVLFYFAFVSVYCATYLITPEAYNLIYRLIPYSTFWLCVLVVPIIAVLPDVAYRASKFVFTSGNPGGYEAFFSAEVKE